MNLFKFISNTNTCEMDLNLDLSEEEKEIKIVCEALDIDEETSRILLYD